ncbi:transmembrane protein 209-like [Portunus trituberculatus]|uniref:transmembrane protein 209-like n=1 Tax=Portunus trituberculatus TaxID=210409 RepID=UPI001E1CE2DA|nr:transmembrane protein 209-like [Portunus trituberculatus]XP_045138030.1 transmembrane protein 209-like [Portunus trituberculatus]
MAASQLVQDALVRKTAAHSLLWGGRSAGLLVFLIAVFTYDLQNGGVSGWGGAWWWVCWCVCTLLGVLLVRLLLSALLLYLTLPPLEVSDKQRQLMNITQNDFGFKSSSPQQASSTPVAEQKVPLSSLFSATVRTPSPAPPLSPINLTTASWSSLSPQSPLAAASHNSSLGLSASMLSSGTAGSVTADSWSFHRNQSSLLDLSFPLMSGSQTQPQQQMFQPPLTDSLLSQPLPSPATPPASPASPITDEASLQSYLHHHREKEKLRQIMYQCEGSSSSLWGYGGSPRSSLADHGASLRKAVYQPANRDTGQETNSADSKNDSSKTSTSSSSSVSKIWRKRNVTPEQLFKFTENLRIWMSATLLVPLVQNIDATNKVLRGVAPEIQIGAVGVDKLKKTAQNISGLKQLADVVPFLEVTVHQDYLLHRLRELASGGAISAYRWNSGSTTFNSRPWKEEYPTDTAILLHLFAMHLDQQLPPDIAQPEGRMFSSTHVIKAPEKPPKTTHRPLLYLSQVTPPHVKVVLPPEEECDVGSGRNNLTHALLLFIHYVIHCQHSRIANINLSMSGVNLSWVIGADKVKSSLL